MSLEKKKAEEYRLKNPSSMYVQATPLGTRLRRSHLILIL